jgi:hypothetical protein
MCLLSANGAVSWQRGASPQEFKSRRDRALKARFNRAERESRFQRLAYGQPNPWGDAPGWK